MADKEKAFEECIHEGRIAGIFTGFRNYDTIFKFEGGSAWRQDEYHFEYHYLYSPKAKIIRVREETVDHKVFKEIFYIEVEGIKRRVQVKGSYA